MNKEKDHYKLINLHLLIKKQQPAIPSFEKQHIERCDNYIEHYNALVNKFRPQDVSISISANELDNYLNVLDKKYPDYRDYMDTDNYQKFCEASTDLNKWKALKSELTSISK